MTLDNFEKIKPLLKFEQPGNFYFIQIFKRRKDNSSMQMDMQVIRDYYVYSENDLDRLRDQIITECRCHNARA